MKEFKQNPKILKIIAGLLTESAEINIESKSLKEFLRNITEIKGKSKEIEYDFIEILLDSLLNMVKPNFPKDVFSFDGSNDSGVSIIEKSELPPDGIGFFGWVRYESPPKDIASIIFSIEGKHEQLELSINNGILTYSVFK